MADMPHPEERIDLANVSGFQRDMLVAVATADPHKNGDLPHGLSVMERTEEVRGEPVNHGRHYPNLNKLVDAGLVEKVAIDARTNGCRLTERGRRVLQNVRHDADYALKMET